MDRLVKLILAPEWKEIEPVLKANLERYHFWRIAGHYFYLDNRYIQAYIPFHVDKKPFINYAKKYAMITGYLNRNGENVFNYSVREREYSLTNLEPVDVTHQFIVDRFLEYKLLGE